MDRRQFLKAGGLGLASLPLASMANSTLNDSLFAKDIKHWDHHVDVLIVGSGAGGISAAIEARRSGSKVLVLEKFHRLSGSSGMSGGVCYLGGGTPLQKALGFQDSTEAMFDFIMAAGRKHPNQAKVQAYCEGSVEHYHWLEKNGVAFQEKYSDAKGLPGDFSSLYNAGCEHTLPYRNISKPAPRGHVPYKKGMRAWTGGKVLMQALNNSALSLGVKIQNKTQARSLILNSDGSVAGLRAQQKDTQGKSKEVNIKANKGVVLAAGGFIHNRPMVKHYAPELYDCSVPWGNAGDMGDGILMAMAIGAACERMDQGFAVLPLYQPEQTLGGIVVNQYGQRYVSEDTYHGVLGHETAYNQHGKAFFISDKTSDFGFKDWRHTPVAQSKGISELEQQLNIAPGALTQTVDYYNQHAHKHIDPLMGKDKKYLHSLTPPFKAYDLAPNKAFYAAHTFGGLSTTTDNEVLNVYGNVIPGLFAAGRTTSGLPTSPYIASGLSIGDCTFFGRRAGTKAAARKV